jgi:hypothetical protein
MEPAPFSLISLPFVHRANRSFVGCPSVDEETIGSYLFAYGLKRTCQSVLLLTYCGYFTSLWGPRLPASTWGASPLPDVNEN